MTSSQQQSRPVLINNRSMYSSLGSYGGFGSLGSNFGSGSSFGSSYGSSFGSGYGSLMSRGAQQGQGQQQEQNLRGEYYGMLGGLNSILQLGFAGISLTVFVQNVAGIVKTSYNWFKTVTTRFSKFLINLPLVRLIPFLFAKLNFKSLLKPATAAGSKNKKMYYLRLLALVGLVIMVYVRSQIKNQIDKQYEDMLKEEEKENQDQIKEKEQPVIQMNGQFHQKQGFF